MQYPIYKIENLDTINYNNGLFTIDKLEDYIPKNPKVKQLHQHSFYHLAFIINGSGKHWIDFLEFEVLPGSFYLMRPGQIHKWQFEDNVEGFIINFRLDFLALHGIHNTTVQQFPLLKFDTITEQYILNNEQVALIEAICFQLYNEQINDRQFSKILLASKLLELLALLNRYVVDKLNIVDNVNDRNYHIFNQFIQLLEQHYIEYKLPKDYANILHITSHQLNQITQQIASQSAGSIIRNRIVLEAKRLLVSKEKTVSEIAFSLNFNDNSYFVKFFKNIEGMTPDQFRNTVKN